MAHWIALPLALLVMLAGLIGTFMPALPGLPLIWLAMLGYGLLERFHAISVSFLAIALLAVVAAQVAEHWSRAYGAKRFGAGRAGTWGAVIGSIVGLFFMPIGLVLGPFLGAAAGELLAGREGEEAVRAGWGAMIGVLGSVLINVVLALGLIAAFLWKVLV